jgi:hypothetical protein
MSIKGSVLLSSILFQSFSTPQSPIFKQASAVTLCFRYYTVTMKFISFLIMGSVIPSALAMTGTVTFFETETAWEN